jgi:Fur family ferric uptake transcriptional regulator
MEKQLDRLCGALQGNGYRLTTARLAILRVLIKNGDHLSAAELASLVREEAPNVGRMTVYRTLDLLNELGLVRPVYQGSGAAHYVLMDGGHHHHLVCAVCHKVIEFDDCVLGEIEELVCGRYQFQVESHLLELYGRCPDCQPISE